MIRILKVVFIILIIITAYDRKKDRRQTVCNSKYYDTEYLTEQ